MACSPAGSSSSFCWLSGGPISLLIPCTVLVSIRDLLVVVVLLTCVDHHGRLHKITTVERGSHCIEEWSLFLYERRAVGKRWIIGGRLREGRAGIHGHNMLMRSVSIHPLAILRVAIPDVVLSGGPNS